MKACGAEYGAYSSVSCSFMEMSKPPNAGAFTSWSARRSRRRVSSKMFVVDQI